MSLVVPRPEDADIVEGLVGEHGGSLILSSTQEPRTLNPLVSEDQYSSLIVDRIMSSLVNYDWVQRQITPGLAMKWSISSDGRSYTFHLRKGIQWSDGKPITADDVIFTFDSIFDPAVINRYKVQFTYSGELLKYEKLDDYTVRFTTPKVYAPFLDDIGSVSIIPKHVFAAAKDDGNLSNMYSMGDAGNNPASIIGSGPFRVKYFRSGERMVLERNPYYWRYDSAHKQLPYLDYHIIKFVKDPNTAMFLFGTGQVHVSGVSPTDLGWLRKSSKLYHFRIERQGTRNGITFKWFNMHPGNNKEGHPYVQPHKLQWFTNKKFRQAIMYGTDRQGAIEALLVGRGQPLHSPIPPCKGEWHNPNVRQYSYQPEKARHLLKEAGFRYRENGLLEDNQGNLVEIEYLTTKSGGPAGDAMDTAFVENMKALGITIELVPVDFGTLIIKTGDSFDYEMSALGWGGGTDEPSGSRTLFLSNGRFHLWHPNQEKPATEWEARVDQLFMEQEGTLDRARRLELMHEIQEIFAEEVPLLFGIITDTYYGVSNQVQNLKVPEMGSVIWNIDELWIKEDNAL